MPPRVRYFANLCGSNPVIPALERGQLVFNGMPHAQAGGFRLKGRVGPFVHNVLNEPVGMEGGDVDALGFSHGRCVAKHGTGAVLVYRPNVPAVIKGLREHSSRLPEIVEARSTLEVKLAELAALRRSAEDMKAIDKALEAMAEEVASGARGAHGGGCGNAGAR
jgi:hypothetical protein